MFKALRQVFSKLVYIVLAVVVTFLLFALSVWLPNLKLIWQIVTSSTIAVSDKIGVLASLLTSIGTNFSLFSASYTIAIAVLFGINLAMVVYYMRQRKSIIAGGGAVGGFGGLVSGLFGVGCAACGTLVLAPLLALVGAGGLISFLPLNGGEFGLLSIGILSWSISFTAKKIGEPLACEVKSISEDKLIKK